MLLVSFMLFSLFFGAGNLIFPPFLGQNAGGEISLCGYWWFLDYSCCFLPVLGVVVVARFDGLERLASRVNAKFAIVFTILILFLLLDLGLQDSSSCFCTF